MKMRKSKEESILYKRTSREKIIFGVIFIIFITYSLIMLLPLVYLLINSFQDSFDYYMNLGESGNAFAFPKRFKFENYSFALKNMYMVNSMGEKIYLTSMFLNSIWYVSGSVLLGVFGAACTAYILSKYRFKGKDAIYAVIIFTMTIPIVGSTGSSLKMMSDLGIYNTPLFLITSFCGYGFNFIILYGFFKNLPWDYAEAAFIDGASHFQVFFKVMLPQATSAMVTLIIMAGISAWNDYMTPLLYMPDFPTVASGLYRIQVSFKRIGDMPAYFAGLVMSTIPVIAIFAIFSDKIMKNFTMGGLKG